MALPGTFFPEMHYFRAVRTKGTGFKGSLTPGVGVPDLKVPYILWGMYGSSAKLQTWGFTVCSPVSVLRTDRFYHPTTFTFIPSTIRLEFELN